MENQEEINAQIKRVFIDTFHISPETYSLTMSPGNPKEWDSLGNQLLLMNLEKAFKCTIDEEEILQINSVADISQILLKKLESR
jgi:acyl carrier protein